MNSWTSQITFAFFYQFRQWSHCMHKFVSNPFWLRWNKGGCAKWLTSQLSQTFPIDLQKTRDLAHRALQCILHVKANKMVPTRLCVGLQKAWHSDIFYIDGVVLSWWLKYKQLSPPTHNAKTESRGNYAEAVRDQLWCLFRSWGEDSFLKSDCGLVCDHIHLWPANEHH